MTVAPQSEAVREIPEDPATFDRASLESDTSAKLADIFKDGDGDLSEVEAEKPSKESPAAATEKAQEEEVAVTPEKEKEPAASEQEKTPTPAATPETFPTVSTVPAAYRRSLKAYQWTDEEIDAAAKANPDGFLKTAEKIHMTRVDETRRWADLGRNQKAAAPASEKKPEPLKFDAAALRAKYGDEPFITAMEAQHAQLEQAQAFINQSRDRQQAAEQQGLIKQIDDYFGGKDLEPYHDHYGKAGQTLTDVQLASRGKVLEMADLLISGARSMGHQLTLDEALTKAHDATSSPIAAKVAVKKIETQVRARQNAISQRPGSRASAPAKDDRKALESQVGKGLAAVFNKK